MRAEYTIRASVVYEITLMAEDEDEALELALQYNFKNWGEIDAEFFIHEITPVTMNGPRHDDD